ncbi:MAG: tetratricopeptide repeat protein, partial [Planctomycetota bacterium]
DDRFICRQTSDKLLQVAELVQARHYLQAVEDMELERMALRELSLTASQPAEQAEREPAPEREQPEPEREQARGETEKPEPEPAAAQPTRREEQMAQRELQIGNTQLKAGLPNRAMQSYRNVVEKYPRTAAAKVARKRIKELEPRRR